MNIKFTQNYILFLLSSHITITLLKASGLSVAILHSKFPNVTNAARLKYDTSQPQKCRKILRTFHWVPYSRNVSYFRNKTKLSDKAKRLRKSSSFEWFLP